MSFPGSAVALASVLLLAMAPPSTASEGDEGEQALHANAAEHLERLHRIEIETYGADEIHSATERLGELLHALDRVLADEQLDAGRRLDLELVRAQVRRRHFELDELRLHELIPTSYLALDATSGLFLRPCAAPDAAVRRAGEELARLPTVLANARRNLRRPARVWTENAIETSRHASHMLERELESVCIESAGLRRAFLTAGEAAAQAVADYRRWLETELLPRSDRPPVWAPEQVEVYQFEHEFLDGYGVDEMLAIATEEDARTMEEMRALARRIHPSGDVRTVWELMKDETPPWSEIPEMARRYVEITEGWLRSAGRHVVEIPERFDYGVQITSPMARRLLSFGGASYGPTVGGRISGYYVLTPIEPWIDEASAASRLRSYNPYWTHVISYHEWLGHNVQRAVAHAHAEGPVRRSFQSIYLSQAWSFYLEKLLEDEGYFEDTLPHVEALKTRMARLQMRMWRIQRILTKLGMAKGTMTFEEAVRAYVERIGMEPTNAFIEVQRDSQSPSPPGREIIGERIILELRDEYRSRMGDHYTLAGFHEALLRYGNLPLPVVRRLMFGDL